MPIEAIAAASMSISAMETATALDVAMTKKTMEVQETMAANLIQSLAQAIPAPATSFGHKLDVLA